MSEINRDPIYILNDPDDAREALLKAACMYMDFYEYWCALNEIEAQFDESIEVYDTPMWIGIDEARRALTPVATTYGILRETTNCFDRLAENARKSCKDILLQMLDFPAEKVKSVIGFTLDVPKSKRKRFVAFFFEYLRDNGMEFDQKDFFLQGTECRDPIQAMAVKSHRFLSILEQVKDMEIPPKKAPCPAGNSLGGDYKKNLIESMSKFTKMREQQSHCLCNACHSDFWADNNDIECGMVKCPGCGGTDQILLLREKEQPTQEEIDNSYVQAASQYIVGDKMICFCPTCNKDRQIPIDEAKSESGKCPKCGNEVVRYI